MQEHFTLPSRRSAEDRAARLGASRHGEQIRFPQARREVQVANARTHLAPSNSLFQQRSEYSERFFVGLWVWMDGLMELSRSEPRSSSIDNSLSIIHEIAVVVRSAKLLRCQAGPRRQEVISLRSITTP